MSGGYISHHHSDASWVRSAPESLSSLSQFRGPPIIHRMKERTRPCLTSLPRSLEATQGTLTRAGVRTPHWFTGWVSIWTRRQRTSASFAEESFQGKK